MRFRKWLRFREAFEVVKGVPEALQIFGLQSVPDSDTLAAIYRKLVKAHHPDRGGDTEQFKRIQAAYGILINKSNSAQSEPSPDQSIQPDSKMERNRTRAALYKVLADRAKQMGDTAAQERWQKEYEDSMAKLREAVCGLQEEEGEAEAVPIKIAVGPSVKGTAPRRRQQGVPDPGPDTATWELERHRTRAGLYKMLADRAEQMGDTAAQERWQKEYEDSMAKLRDG